MADQIRNLKLVRGIYRINRYKYILKARTVVSAKTTESGVHERVNPHAESQGQLREAP